MKLAFIYPEPSLFYISVNETGFHLPYALSFLHLGQCTVKCFITSEHLFNNKKTDPLKGQCLNQLLLFTTMKLFKKLFVVDIHRNPPWHYHTIRKEEEHAA